MIEKIRNSEHLDLLRWLLVDTLSRFKRDVVISIVASLIRIVTQFGALGLVFTYATYLESNREINLLDYKFLPQESLYLLVFVAILGLILYLLSGIAAYISRTKALDLWREYEDICMKRMIVLLSRIPNPSSLIANKMLKEDVLSKDGSGEARFCGRTFQLLLNTFIPLSSLLVFLAVLFYISIYYTIIILIFSSVCMILLRKISKQIMDSMEHQTKLDKAYSSEKSKLINRINKFVSPLTHKDSYLSNMFSEGEHKKHQDSFFKPFFLRERTSLVVNSFSAISIITIIIIAGIGIIYGHFNWSIFFAYLVSLQYFLMNMLQLANSLAMFSRFYPSARKYQLFVADAQNATFMDSDKEIDDKSLFLKLNDVEGKNDNLELKPGKLNYIYARKTTRRVLASHIYQNMKIKQNNERPLYWFIEKFDFSGMTLRQAYGFPDSFDDEKLLQEFDQIMNGGGEERKLTGLGDISLDDIITEKQYVALSDDTINGLQLLSAIHSNRKILLFDEKDFINLTKIIDRPIEGILSRRIIVLVTISDRIPKIEDKNTPYIFSNSKGFDNWCTIGLIEKNPDIFSKMIKAVSIKDKGQDGSEVGDFEFLLT
jgi:ABC-type multidrug transport system fused ATPase/permease subunit